MQKAVVYARYSSDLQNDKSIDDQFGEARAYAEREGFEITATYSDRPWTSATLFDRDGLITLMQEAKAGRFQVVIVECLDRISRDQEDLPAVYKRLSFAGVEIHTLNEGLATPMNVGLRGLFGQLFLKDLGAKVRRHHTAGCEKARSRAVSRTATGQSPANRASASFTNRRQ
jgi:site-specific DNA recombinase